FTVFQGIGLGEGFKGKFSGLAHRDKACPEFLCQHGGEDKAPAVDPDHLIHLGSPDKVQQGHTGRVKGLWVVQQWTDVLKGHPGLWKILNIPDIDGKVHNFCMCGFCGKFKKKYICSPLKRPRGATE